MYPLPDEMQPFAKNQWYVAAWSNEVSRDPMERRILDEPVAFYRTEAGQVVAVEGRCPHRSFPLGKSRVVGDNIQCGYHGISFRPDGSCASIPSQELVPKNCSIRSFPVVEVWEWVWIWMGDPALADASKIPDHFEIGLTDPASKVAGGLYRSVPGRYMLLHDNLWDLTHVGHLHRNTLGAGGGAVDMVPEHEVGDDWISSFYSMKNIDCPPYFAGLLRYTGKIDRRSGLKLYLPCLHVGGTEVRISTASSDSPGKLLGSVKVFHAITPATPYTTHYFFASGHTYPHDDPHHAEQLTEKNSHIIDEDVLASGYIEEMIQSGAVRPGEVLLRADHICVKGRRMFERLIREEAALGGNARPMLSAAARD